VLLQGNGPSTHEYTHDTSIAHGNGKRVSFQEYSFGRRESDAANGFPAPSSHRRACGVSLEVSPSTQHGQAKIGGTTIKETKIKETKIKETKIKATKITETQDKGDPG